MKKAIAAIILICTFSLGAAERTDAERPAVETPQQEMMNFPWAADENVNLTTAIVESGDRIWITLENRPECNFETMCTSRLRVVFLKVSGAVSAQLFGHIWEWDSYIDSFRVYAEKAPTDGTVIVEVEKPHKAIIKIKSSNQ